MKRRWRPIPLQGFIHTCCTCGAKHDVDVRLHRGVLDFRWTPIITPKRRKTKLKNARNDAK